MIGITGIGVYVPQHSISIEELATHMTKEQIKKTGIKSVLYEPDLSATDMAVEASKMAVKAADISPVDIDWIINTQATLSDYLTWQVSAKVQNDIGASDACFFDLYQNCSGFITGLITAKHFLNGENNTKAILLNTSEKWDATVKSRMVGKLVMGEAAAAAVIEKESDGNFILGYSQIGIGNLHDVARMNVGTVNHPYDDYPEEEYYYHINNEEKARKDMIPVNIDLFVRVGMDAIKNSGLNIKDISHIIFPNVGFGLFEKVMDRFDMPLEQTNFRYVCRTGDCGTVDTLLNYYRMLKDGLLKKSDNVLLIAQGAGATWAAIVIQV